MNDINLVETYACSNCWSKVESFHEFYVTVETNYHKKFNHNDAKMFGNPLLDCEPESIIDEAMVKVEIHQFDSSVSDYETVFVPSTSYWDDSNKQIDSFTESNGNTNAVPSIKQELVAIGRNAVLKRKSGLKTQMTKSTLRQRKNVVKTKSQLKKPKTVDLRKKEFRKNTRIIEEIV